MAVINVGAATETEMKEKKARVEDALHATRAAVEEGIVPGGGVALIRCLEAIDKVKGSNEDERIGVDIVKTRRSSSRPAQLANNAGVEGSVVVEEVKKRKGNEGYNVADQRATKTSSKPAWWTPRRSPAPRCRTRRPSPACS